MILELQTERASRYLEGVFAGFLADPADTDYQKGFLSMALTLYREGLGKGIGDDRLTLLDRQIGPPTLTESQ
jgi:hypothetical protein